MSHFVLDQNFPLQATGLPWPPDLRVTRLSSLEPELTAGHDDWEILRRLDRRGDVDGFITNDDAMLNLPREMVVLSATRVTLVVTQRVGHDPVRATGLLMVSLGQIARQLTGRPQIFMLTPPELGRHRTDPAARLTAIAQHRNVPRHELIAAERAYLDRLP
jgi:hypothetical protein